MSAALESETSELKENPADAVESATPERRDCTVTINGAQYLVAMTVDEIIHYWERGADISVPGKRV